ncbi:MAG: antibiotic biosynthesis monooxygenase [Gemmatimonadales bacterium]|nr:antibiotic biosynthesis monooxygenase [Gemmatimonadales bacterium]MBA3554306.1 antibiotic biosynthesis monooxygenase [Gemmatimonadales bacterium]
MIARVWRGVASAAQADAYLRHVAGSVFPALARLAGQRGGWVLKRETAGQVEFLVVSFWDSLDAIRTFAGPDPERAVVEPAARALLAEFDEVVRHYEVAHSAEPKATR